MSGKSLAVKIGFKETKLMPFLGNCGFLHFLTGKLCRDDRESHLHFYNPKAFQNPSLEWVRGLSQSWQRKQLEKII